MATIVIIADDARQRHALIDVGQSCGLEVLSCIASRQFDQQQQELVPDLWLVDVEDEDNVLDRIGYDQTFLVGLTTAPSFTDQVPYSRWKQAITRKLLKVLAGTDAHLPNLHPCDLFPEVWRVVLLAASMGGLDAVKLFLDQVPSDLPVAFLLIQHIDQKMQNHLPRILGRHNDWQFILIEHDIFTLECGKVYIVPVAQQVNFTSEGHLCLQAEHWAGSYQPSISDMMYRASQTFKDKLLTIVFSGMGNDGSKSAYYHGRQGAKLWAQSAESCICASQPDQMRGTGQVSFNADPAGLATALINEYSQNRETIT